MSLFELFEVVVVVVVVVVVGGTGSGGSFFLDMKGLGESDWLLVFGLFVKGVLFLLEGLEGLEVEVEEGWGEG